MFYNVFWYCDELGGSITSEIEDTRSNAVTRYGILKPRGVVGDKSQDSNSSKVFSSKSRYRSKSRPPSAPNLLSLSKSKGKRAKSPTWRHRCDHFAFPPPPVDRRRTGPRRKSYFPIWPCLHFLTQTTISNMSNNILLSRTHTAYLVIVPLGFL